MEIRFRFVKKTKSFAVFGEDTPNGFNKLYLPLQTPETVGELLVVTVAAVPAEPAS